MRLRPAVPVRRRRHHPWPARALAACVLALGACSISASAASAASAASTEKTLAGVRQLAERVTGEPPGALIVVTFVNEAFQGLLSNWVVFARRANVTRFLVGALDAPTFHFCKREQLPAFPAYDDRLLRAVSADLVAAGLSAGVSVTQLAGADFRQDSAAFRSMGLRKAALALSLLKVGYHVVMTDADALWLSPPLDFFLSSGIAREADVMASSDSLAPAAEARLVATEAKTEDGAAAWWQEPSVPVTLEQNGNFLDASFNTGVLFFRSNNASRLAVAHWAAAIITEGDTLHGAHTWDDQQAFGELMRMGPEGKSMMYPPTALKLVPGGQGRVFWAMNSRVRLGVLPVGLFANGHTFFVQAAQALPGAPWPVLVHNTFQFFGESGKKARFRAFGLWAAPGADRPGPRERYLTWNATPPAELRAELEALYWIPGESAPAAASAAASGASSISASNARGPGLASHLRLVAWHLLSLRNALALGRVLGRTVVVPRLECHCDRYWYPILPRCRAPGSELALPFFCPLDQIVNVHRWEASAAQPPSPEEAATMELRIPFRQQSFLEDKHVPAAVRDGVVRVEVGGVPSTVPGSGPPLRDRKDGISLPTAATESQAWGALGGLSAPVLYLTDAAGAFCSFDSTKANAAFDAEMGYALNNSWCCARSGGVQFDLPEPLSASHQRTTESVAGDGAGAGAGGGGGSAAEASGEEQVGGTGRGLCVPKAPPGAYPSVLRALELQQDCKDDHTCWTDCRNRLKAHGVAPGQKCVLPPPPAAAAAAPTTTAAGAAAVGSHISATGGADEWHRRRRNAMTVGEWDPGNEAAG